MNSLIYIGNSCMLLNPKSIILNDFMSKTCFYFISYYYINFYYTLGNLIETKV